MMESIMMRMMSALRNITNEDQPRVQELTLKYPFVDWVQMYRINGRDGLEFGAKYLEEKEKRRGSL